MTGTELCGPREGNRLDNIYISRGDTWYSPKTLKSEPEEKADEKGFGQNDEKIKYPLKTTGRMQVVSTFYFIPRKIPVLLGEDWGITPLCKLSKHYHPLNMV